MQSRTLMDGPLFGYICIADYYLVPCNNRGTCTYIRLQGSHMKITHHTSFIPHPMPLTLLPSFKLHIPVSFHIPFY